MASRKVEWGCGQVPYGWWVGLNEVGRERRTKMVRLFRGAACLS